MMRKVGGKMMFASSHWPKLSMPTGKMTVWTMESNAVLPWWTAMMLGRTILDRERIQRIEPLRRCTLGRSLGWICTSFFIAFPSRPSFFDVCHRIQLFFYDTPSDRYVPYYYLDDAHFFLAGNRNKKWRFEHLILCCTQELDGILEQRASVVFFKVIFLIPGTWWHCCQSEVRSVPDLYLKGVLLQSENVLDFLWCDVVSASLCDVFRCSTSTKKISGRINQKAGTNDQG